MGPVLYAYLAMYLKLRIGLTLCQISYNTHETILLKSFSTIQSDVDLTA